MAAKTIEVRSLHHSDKVDVLSSARQAKTRGKETFLARPMAVRHVPGNRECVVESRWLPRGKQTASNSSYRWQNRGFANSRNTNSWNMTDHRSKVL